MFVSPAVDQFAKHFGPEWTTFGWIVMTFGPDIHGVQRMIQDLVLPPLALHVRSRQNISKTSIDQIPMKFAVDIDNA